jgi:hypothetical protein
MDGRIMMPKMDVGERLNVGVYLIQLWLRIETMAGSCEHGNEFYKILGISYMAEQLLASQEGLM